MRVDSHTQIRQAMRVLIHTHIFCRLLVEGIAPKPPLNTEFHSVAARSANAFLSVPGTPFRSMGVRESRPPFVDMEHPETAFFSFPLPAKTGAWHAPVPADKRS